MKRIVKKYFYIGMAMLYGAISLTGCGESATRYNAVNTAMGTVINQTIYTTGDDITGGVEQLIEDLESETLSWRIADSEIGRINAGAGSESSLSELMTETLNTLWQVSKESGGAFDLTIGAVARLWNIDEWVAGENESETIPDQEQIEQMLADTGYSKVTVSGESIFLPEGMQLDLGAVGKGIACDEIAKYLEEQHVRGAVISVGGSILTYGEKPDGTPWQVGITDPFETSELVGVLSLEGGMNVSTSGDYERYVEVDGVRYHHILDPSTGYPANSGLHSVTIVSDSGMLSDALSTACFVLGEEAGMELAERYGVEALFIGENGELSMTEGMEKLFTSR